jgi:hypothetical protein
MPINYIKKDISKLFNIGDSLCTADVYFDIETEYDIRIIGGGVWDIRKKAIDIDAKNTILWAAGESFKDLSKVPQLETKNFKFTEWSVRDKDLLEDKTKFVPCVSCFHNDILREPVDNKTMIFTNANFLVSTNTGLKEETNRYVVQNSISYDDFISKWKKSSRIITNSYHGIYWGLLSGREVAPFGYSSKFVSVMKLFDLDFPVDQLYNVKNKAFLPNMLTRKDKKYFKLTNGTDFIEEFRDINMSFVEKLDKIGVKCRLIEKQ